MRTTTRKLLALGTAAALGLAACGGSDEETGPAVSGEARPVATTAPAEGAPAAAEVEPEADEVPATVDDAASTLLADLTALLQEQVHLTGMAVDAIAEEGPDSPGAQAAGDALDAAATAFGDRIGALPGAADAGALLEPWREHVGGFVDYATARAEEDDAAADEAMSALEDGLQPIADFFEQVSDEEILADELYGELETHTTMLTDAIDALVTGDEEGPDLLREAALHMDGIATGLAEGIVAAHPEEIPGDAVGVPAETRARLTSSLVEHTYLTLLAAGEAVDAGGAAADPAVQAATTTMDGSADGLANVIGGAGGNEAREAFLDVWRPFLTATADYASASAAGDAAGADQARATLEAMPAAVAELIRGATAGNAPADLAGLLATHVTNLTGAIDAVVTGDPAAYAQARTAAGHASAIAAGVAGAFVAADPASGEGGTEPGSAGSEDAEGLNADPSTAAPDQAETGSAADAGSEPGTSGE